MSFFPEAQIKFNDEFEGLESSVIINLTNGSLNTYPSLVPLSITRANSHLIMFLEDYRGIMKEACQRGLAIKSTQGVQEEEIEVLEAQTVVGLQEVIDFFCSLGRTLTLPSIQSLARDWNMEEYYNQLVGENRTRFVILKEMCQRFTEENPGISVQLFFENIRCTNITDEVNAQIFHNLVRNIQKVKDSIPVMTSDQIISLAHTLGYKNSFNSLTCPEDSTTPALSDQAALETCLDLWKVRDGELIGCVFKAKLNEFSEQLHNDFGNFDIASYKDLSISEKTTIGFLPLLFPRGYVYDDTSD